MASISQAETAESQDSTANNGEDGGISPLPVTSRYESMKNLLHAVKDAIGAADNLSMEDTDAATVKWANAIESAVYEGDESLGAMQKETPYTTKQFTEQFGDSITTPHDDLTGGERTQLRKLFKDSENHSESDAEGQFKLPVVNGERLPLLVADEDVLSEGREMLQAILDEDNDAGSTTSDVETDDEGYNLLREGTLEDLEREMNDDECYYTRSELENMLSFEKDHKDRKGGKEMLESAIEDLESDDDEDAGSTTDDLTAEEVSQIAAEAAAKAVEEALGN